MANYELNVKINGVEQSVNTIGELEQALVATNNELQKTEQTSKSFGELTRQAQNIENYLGVLTQDAATFNSQLKTVSTTTSTLGTTFQQTADAAEQLGNGANLTGLNQAVEETTTRTTSLRAELRQITQELQNLEPGSQRFQELSVRAGELRDNIADTNNVVTALAGNTTERLGTALSGVVNIGITGLQGVVGSMQLFGVESEKARDVMEKLQGLLFVTQAIQGFGGLSDSIAQITAGLSSLTSARAADLSVQEAQVAANSAEAATDTINTAAQTANTVATEAHATAAASDAVATGAATVATEGFTAALAANPIGLVVVGLTALISALFVFSGGQETAKTNIDETTNSMLEQSNVMKQQEDDFIQLYKARKELEILQEKDATKRAEMQKALEAEVLGLQQDALEKQAGAAMDANAKLLSEFDKYKQAYIGERQVLVREVAQYDEFGVFIGMEQQYRTEKFKIGEGTLNDLRDRLAKEKEEITKDINSKKITQEEGRIREEQATTRFYIEYLTKQKEFLKSSSKASDETYAQNLEKLITSFQKTRTALEKALADQIRIQQEAEKKRLEEEQKAAEEAERKRQAALDRAREQYKQAYDAIKNSIKTRIEEAQAIEQKYLDELTKSKFTTKLEEVAFEQEQEEKKLEEIDKFRKEDVAKSKVLGKEKQKLITQIETETTQARVALDNFYAEKRRKIIEEETKLEEAKAAKLLQINQVLQKEISFGDQSITDTKESLALREQQIALSRLDFEFQNNEQSLKSTREFLEKRLVLQQDILQRQRSIEELEAEAESVKRLGNFSDFLEKEFGLTELARQKQYDAERVALDTQRDLVLNSKTATDAEKLAAENLYQQQVAALDDKYIQESKNKEIKAAEDALKSEKEILDKRLKEKSITQKEYDDALIKANADYNKKLTDADTKYNADAENLASSYYQTRVNNEQEVATKRKEINEKYRQEEVKATEDTEEKTLDIRIAALDKWAKFAVETLNTVLGLFQAISDLQKTNLDNQLIDLKLYNEARQNEINTQFNSEVAALQKQLQDGLITQETYNAAVTKLETNRTANSEKLLEAQRQKELQIKKKSFEDDKKLKTASAIISGIQGAVAAFTGAFTSIPNPIAASVVGGIMAALVAATTAVQVTAIQRQKFDSSGSVPGVEAVSTNAPSSTTSAITQASSGGFTSFNQSAMGGPQNTAGTTGFTSGSQRVYVLESDITGVQDRVKVLESNSTFG